jgi:hypothetical protein
MKGLPEKLVTAPCNIYAIHELIHDHFIYDFHQQSSWFHILYQILEPRQYKNYKTIMSTLMSTIM